MKITQFKKMLSVHGSDLSRWEGASESDVRALMATSEDAQALYKDAMQLDAALATFEPAAPDAAILNNVLRRIGAEGEQPAASVHSFAEKKAQKAKTAFIPRPVYWGGAAAIAAALVLFVSSLSGPLPERAVAPQNTVVAMQDAPAADPEVEVVLAELETFTEEEIARHEINGLWQLAEAKTDARSEDNIDAFLDELFTEQPQDSGLQEEMDLWELFLKAQQEQQVREL